MAGVRETTGESVLSEDATNYSYSTTTVNLSSSTVPEASDISDFTLNLPYTVCEVVVAVTAAVGNALVLAAFVKDKKLRRRTNYYIVSLAIADFLVGLIGIPVALLASVGLPRGIHACLFSICFLITLCSSSIFSLLAVSVDRYWAILHPLAYTKDVCEKTAIVIICICWVAAIIVGFLPMMGWNAGYDSHCFFVKVMDYDYLVFLYFATIITPALLMAFFYADIYRVVLQQVRKRIAMDAYLKGSQSRGGRVGNLALLGAAQQWEIRVTQNLAIIVIFFVVCWVPLYTVNCITAFCPDCPVPIPLLPVLIILSHLNSSVNPIIYAYRLKDFREALSAIFCIKKGELPANDYLPSFPKGRPIVADIVVKSQDAASQSSTTSTTVVVTNFEAPSPPTIAVPMNE